MIIDGKQISAEILEEVRSMLTQPCTIRAIVVAPTAATRSYLRIKERSASKAGIMLEVVELFESASEDDIRAAIQEARSDAVIVQLPLAEHLKEANILHYIPVEKDADVLSSLGKEKGTLIAPVAGAVQEILTRAGIDPEGMRAVVVGRGRLVGEPVARYLEARGAKVSSYDMHDFTPDVLKEAHIIVSGAGSPHLITPEMLSPGAVLIDAGTSEQDGALAGDIDPACVERASVYTPVPGGVGPITVACLMRNVALLQKANIQVH